LYVIFIRVLAAVVLKDTAVAPPCVRALNTPVVVALSFWVRVAATTNVSAEAVVAKAATATRRVMRNTNRFVEAIFIFSP
jgi:hypothetical protein